MIRLSILASLAVIMIVVGRQAQITTFDNAKLIALAYGFGVITGLLLSMEFTNRGNST